MNQDFKNCLDKQRLYKSDDAKVLATKELKSAGDDLEDAKFSFSKQRYKWATIQAYYAMFHAARALLYKDGVQEKSHYALSIYLKEKYSNRIPIPILNYLDIHRTERHEAMYGIEYVPTDKDAEIAINDAEIFIREVKKILK